MIELVQNVVVAREGTVNTDTDEFVLDSLGNSFKVSLRYSLAGSERHSQHAHSRINLTSAPIVLGGHVPVTETNYDPKGDSSTFEFITTEFVSRYEFLIQQPIDVFLHSIVRVIAETRIIAKGPERIPEQLQTMPTAILDAPLILAPDKPKQEFLLLVDPFGGQRIKERAILTFRFADEREIGTPAIVPHVFNRSGSGRILDDGTGAVFVVTGLKEQRNYFLELDIDGDGDGKGGSKPTWQATTKTGPHYDDFRKGTILATGG